MSFEVEQSAVNSVKQQPSSATYLCWCSQAMNRHEDANASWSTCHLESPGFHILGCIRLDHMQGFGEAASQGTDVVPDPV